MNWIASIKISKAHIITTSFIFFGWQLLSPCIGFSKTFSDKTKENLSGINPTEIRNFFNDNIAYSFPLIAVDPSIENYFSTPVAWFNNSLYVVYLVTPEEESTGINIKTVIRKYSLNKDGNWYWEINVIEDRTIEDKYHTQPSIGIDKNGYIHVAYNMHNMPWQYSVSKRPEDISEFVFRGRFLSTKDLSIVKYKNQTPFPEIGQTPIPGTQITYPAFFLDRNGELYITYRFSLSPKKKWTNRRFAGAIAKYDADNNQWESIGGSIIISNHDAVIHTSGTQDINSIKTFAYHDNWTVYLIKLFFDVNNSMHASWTWRENGAGRDCSNPSYAFLKNPYSVFRKSSGAPYKTPISLDQADLIHTTNSKFYASTSITADPSGSPYVIVNPIGSSRILSHYDPALKQWSEPELTPHAATELYIDDSGLQWAFASGINIFVRSRNTQWRQIFSEKGYGWPKIYYAKQLDGFFICALRKDRKKFKVLWISKKNALN